MRLGYLCPTCKNDVEVNAISLVKETRTLEYYKCSCPMCSSVVTVEVLKPQLSTKFPPFNLN